MLADVLVGAVLCRAVGPVLPLRCRTVRAQLAVVGLLRHPARLVRESDCQGPPEAVAERRFCVGLGVPAQVRL